MRNNTEAFWLVIGRKRYGTGLAMLGVALAVLPGIAACSSSGTASSASNKTSLTIVVSSSGNTQSLAYLAQAAGLFEKNDINATLDNAGDSSTAVDALAGGHADFALAALTDVLKAKEAGTDVEFLARGTSGLTTDVVLSGQEVKKLHVSPNAPVGQRLKALNGLTLAAPSAESPPQIEVEAAMATEHAKANWVYEDYSVMNAELARNEISGIVGSPPYPQQAILDNTGVMWLNGPVGGIPGGYTSNLFTGPVLVTTESYLKSHQKVAEEVVRAWLEAGALVRNDPSKAKADLGRTQFNNMSAKLYDAVWDQTAPVISSPALTVSMLQYSFAKLGVPSSIKPADVLPIAFLKQVSGS